MPKRKLRIVRPTFPVTAVCEYCNRVFLSRKENDNAAEQEIQAQFDAHKCKPIDSSQKAMRIMRDSTEVK
jgi:hypothetical protein